ncbi:hypothetical protein HD554DRAFT_2015459 [Boletus coccyginus]|nr:hypothetical protein HD554DRAFT_2015459 [Boletus coccyginus]
MLVCRSRSRCLAALSHFSTSPACSTSASSSPAASSTSQPADKPQDSIFTAPESPWDHVFSDIEPVSPPTQRLRTRLDDSNAISPSGRKRSHGHAPNPTQKLLQRSSGVRHQRASITAREMSVFDEMFDLIFNAVSAQEGKGSPPGSASTSSPIGRAGTPLNDLFRTLRRHTSRVRWTTAIDEELDRKKETMELFNTDYDLLQWVTKELFDRSVTAATSAVSSSSSSSRERPGNHSIYPHLIAHAMRIFRTTYSNPSLSLAIFNHAARASIPSYVFGCTAPAYNELIEAKWEGWGDLQGVCNALEEMRANGVKIDGRTRIVVEKVRREVGEARPVEAWQELGEVEVMRLLHRIERLALRDRSRKSTSSPQEESWKSSVLRPGEDDGWSFDGWKKTGDMKKQRGKARSTAPDKIHPRTLDDWTELGTAEEDMAFR